MNQFSFAETLAEAFQGSDGRDQIPHMPVGEAADMGTSREGTPLIDPRLFHSSEYASNPYPYYRIMRDHYPVFHDKLHNCYYVTRYDDAWACAADDRLFHTIPKGIASTVLGNTQLELSGLEHRRRRNLYGQHLVGRALAHRIPAIEQLAREMVGDWDGFAGSDFVQDRDGVRTVELGRAFANEFPVRVVCLVLGFPKEAREKFLYWYHSMMNGFGGSDTHREGLQARQDLEAYVETLVEERRRKPSFIHDSDGNPIAKDLISSLCEARIDGDLLSAEEITSNIALLVGGGGETTRGAILNMWYMLLQHPDQLRSIEADPTLWDAAFHETVRYGIPTGGEQPRHTATDITLHGITIPAGSLVHIVNLSANHDERVFDQPERFNIFRDDLYTGKIIRSGYAKDGRRSHLAFGVGAHLCPGAWISHQEAAIGSKIVLQHMKKPRLNIGKTAKDIDGKSPAPIGHDAVREVWVDFDL